MRDSEGRLDYFLIHYTELRMDATFFVCFQKSQINVCGQNFVGTPVPSRNMTRFCQSRYAEGDL